MGTGCPLFGAGPKVLFVAFDGCFFVFLQETQDWTKFLPCQSSAAFYVFLEPVFVFMCIKCIQIELFMITGDLLAPTIKHNEVLPASGGFYENENLDFMGATGSA